MLRVYSCRSGHLEPVSMPAIENPTRDMIWIDLLRPTDEEERAVETALQIDIPVREELAEIEASSRLYQRGGATFMTATLVARAETGKPEADAVTFILTGDRLVTVRYCEPKAFDLFVREAADPHGQCPSSGTGILIDLLEAIVDRMADHLERVTAVINATSREVLESAEAPRGTRSYRMLLRRIGEEGDFTATIRESLVSLGRVIAFLSAILEPATGKGAPDRSHRALLKTLQRDVLSLTDHASFLSNKITFLLEATIGMVSIEQNEIIKVFSVAAVALLPPTLIASIYGMNFEYMPELDWRIGYPLALGLMVLSAGLPFLYFRRKGWV
jgi:magnesium transporter